jgi:hypothetical protein
LSRCSPFATSESPRRRPAFVAGRLIVVRRLVLVRWFVVCRLVVGRFVELSTVADVERLGLHRHRIFVGDVGVEARRQGCEQAGEHDAVNHEVSFA